MALASRLPAVQRLGLRLETRSVAAREALGRVVQARQVRRPAHRSDGTLPVARDVADARAARDIGPRADRVRAARSRAAHVAAWAASSRARGTARAPEAATRGRRSARVKRAGLTRRTAARRARAVRWRARGSNRNNRDEESDQKKYRLHIRPPATDKGLSVPGPRAACVRSRHGNIRCSILEPANTACLHRLRTITREAGPGHCDTRGSRGASARRERHRHRTDRRHGARVPR